MHIVASWREPIQPKLTVYPEPFDGICPPVMERHIQHGVEHFGDCFGNYAYTEHYKLVDGEIVQTQRTFEPPKTRRRARLAGLNQGGGLNHANMSLAK